jgi:prepilin-type N-terminal cleavage/methylation domain
MQRRGNSAGVTLIEMLVVVALIGLVAAVTFSVRDLRHRLGSPSLGQRHGGELSQRWFEQS